MDLTCRRLPCHHGTELAQPPPCPESAQPPYWDEGAQLLSPPCVGLSLTHAGHPVELRRSFPKATLAQLVASTPMSPLHSPVIQVTSARSLQGPDVMGGSHGPPSLSVMRGRGRSQPPRLDWGNWGGEGAGGVGGPVGWWPSSPCTGGFYCREHGQ